MKNIEGKAKTILPAGIWYQLQVMYRGLKECDESLSKGERGVMEAFGQGGELELNELRALFGATRVS